MRRRDLLAALLSAVAGTGVQSLLDAAADAMAGVVPQSSEDAQPGDDASNSNDDPGRTRTAVVDRIEGDTAVLVFEDGTGTRTVAASVLPAPARETGMVLRVPEGDSLALARVDRVATARRREDASDRFDELATRPPDADASESPPTDASNASATGTSTTGTRSAP